MHKFTLFPLDFSSSQAKKAFAFVSVEPRYSLEETARKIGTLLGNVHMAPTDRFDEYPAFLGATKGLEFALLGPPPPDVDLRSSPTNWLVLQVSPSPKAGGAKPTIEISTHLAEQIATFLGVNSRALKMNSSPLMSGVRNNAEPSGRARKV